MTLLGQCYQDSEYDTNERERGFSLFYVGINAGGAIAAIVCGYTTDLIGWGVGLALPGIGMLFGLMLFIRYRYLLEDHGLAPIGSQDKNTWYQQWGLLLLFAGGFLFSIGAMLLIKNGEYLTHLKGILGVVFLIGLIVFISRVKSAYRRRILAILVLCFFALLFFAIEYQLFAMLSLFAKRNVSHHVFGLYVPAQVFQAINPSTIIISGILLSAFFAKVGIKFSMWRIFIGFVLTTLCFVMLYFACFTANEQSLVGFDLMAISVIVMSIGEVFLAPSIFSLVTFLAPKTLRNTMMGACMLAISFSNISSFIFAKIAAVPKNHGSIDAAQSLSIYQHNFLMVIIYGIVVVAFVLATSRFLHKVIMQRVADET